MKRWILLVAFLRMEKVVRDPSSLFELLAGDAEQDLLRLLVVPHCRLRTETNRVAIS
jgi:hypothetical protein